MFPRTTRRPVVVGGALANRATIESHAVPGGPDLTIDVARLGPADAERLVVVSSGLHGGRGAVRQWRATCRVESRMAPRRRVALDPCPQSVRLSSSAAPTPTTADLKSQLPTARPIVFGAPPHFATVDPVVNPASMSWIDLFIPRLWWLRRKLGEPALRNAVASGQSVIRRGPLLPW